MQPSSVNLGTKVQVGDKALRIEQRLGNGAFGVVYKVKDETTSTTYSSKYYALKVVTCMKFSEIRNAVREVQTLKQISDSNVIKIEGAEQFVDGQGIHMLILMEYCAGGDLNKRLNRPSDGLENLKWICQIVSALAFLHSQGVVHRDLKPDNVLLTITEDVKLADFGLAREYATLTRTGTQGDDGSSTSNNAHYYMTSGTGPIHWVAPEFFSGRYTEKADVFSLGVLIYAILERDFIENNGKKLYGAFKYIPGAGKVGLGYAMAHYDPNITIEFSSSPQDDLRSLALNALKYEKDDRPSANEVLVDVRYYKLRHDLETELQKRYQDELNQLRLKLQRLPLNERWLIGEPMQSRSFTAFAARKVNPCPII